MKVIKLSVLRLARVLGLFRLSRFLTRSRVRILCYHAGNIGDERSFNPLLFCGADFLDARLNWLQDKGFNVVSLSDAVAMLDGVGTRPRLPTVLTFDDGWYSTFSGLHPVIARHGLLATLYLSTGYFVDGKPNLDVTLNYILWKSDRREVTEIHGLDASVDGAYDLSGPSGRARLAGAMNDFLQNNGGSRAEVCATLECFAAQLGVTADDLDLASRRFDFVSRDELTHLATHGWSIELHGHVHHYPVGQPQKFLADLEVCQTEIRKIGLPEPQHYCYPSGNHDEVAHRLLKERGVASATACTPGLIARVDDRQRFYLPRFLDGERIHPLEFESELSGFSDLLRRLAGRH